MSIAITVTNNRLSGIQFNMLKWVLSSKGYCYSLYHIYYYTRPHPTPPSPSSYPRHACVSYPIISSYPGNSDPYIPNIHILVPRIFISLYPAYSYPCTPDIYILVPRIFIPLYPGYAYPCTPDNHIRYSYPCSPGRE